MSICVYYVCSMTNFEKYISSVGCGERRCKNAKLDQTVHGVIVAAEGTTGIDAAWPVQCMQTFASTSL